MTVMPAAVEMVGMAVEQQNAADALLACAAARAKAILIIALFFRLKLEFWKKNSRD